MKKLLTGFVAVTLIGAAAGAYWARDELIREYKIWKM